MVIFLYLSIAITIIFALFINNLNKHKQIKEYEELIESTRKDIHQYFKDEINKLRDKSSYYYDSSTDKIVYLNDVIEIPNLDICAIYKFYENDDYIVLLPYEKIQLWDSNDKTKISIEKFDDTKYKITCIIESYFLNEYKTSYIFSIIIDDDKIKDLLL